MPAKRHINPSQLKMFMTPKELMEHFQPNPGDIDHHDIEMYDDGGNARSDEDINSEFWDIKRDENDLSGLTEDVAAIGVRTPVTVQYHKLHGPVIRGGHHRIAAAMEVNPDMLIPVNYAEDNAVGTAAIDESHKLERHVAKTDKVLKRYVEDQYGGFYQHGDKSPTGWL